MMKKIAILAGAGALLLATAGPAFGWWWGSKDVAIIKDNVVVADANTGSNASVMVDRTNRGGEVEVEVEVDKIDTGNATAYAGSLVVANTHVGCGGCGGGWGHKDVAVVEGNQLAAYANTGGNASVMVDRTNRGGEVEVEVEADDIDTGKADATARSWVIVNTHWSD